MQSMGTELADFGLVNDVYHDDSGKVPVDELINGSTHPLVRRRVLVRPWAVRLAERPAGGVVLSQLFYQTLALKSDQTTRGHHPDDSRGLPAAWTAQSDRQLAEATGLQRSSVSQALNSLRARGLIGWRVLMFAGVPTRHLWLCSSAVQAAGTGDTIRAVAYQPWIARSVAASDLGRLKVSPEAVALVASQILYWHSRRTEDGRSVLHPADERIGAAWLWKAHGAMAAEVGLGVRCVKRVYAALVQLDMVSVVSGMRGGRRTPRVALVLPGWVKALARLS